MASRVKLQSDSRPLALLIGAGYVARHVTPILLAQGYRVMLTFHKRRPEVAGADWIKFGSAEMRTAFERADIVMSSVPPSGGEDPTLSVLANAKTNARWVGYLSATSIYGDRDGQWAFEDEPPNPSLDRGIDRAEAEIAWIETGWPVHIFRLAGIYGPGRAPFKRLSQGTARAIIKDGHVVNRIHVEDIVSALLVSIDAPNPQRIYNLADGNPAPPQDVIDYAASLIDMPPPPRANLNSPDVSDMALSFYAECKRVDNARARKELGWAPKYPDYKAGLRSIRKLMG